MSRRRAPVNEGVAGPSDLHTHLSELDRLARETRDTSQLSEPLADSVLDYTLRRLKPDTNADHGAVQELEKTFIPDELSRVMDEDSASQTQNLSVPTMRLDGQSYLAVGDQGHGGTARSGRMSAPWDRTGTAIMPTLQTNDYDWWQVNLDSIQTPVLPYDELFSLDFNI